MMDRLIDALGRLSGRERWLLALLGAAVLPLALWGLWLVPLAERRVAAETQLVEARALQSWVAARAAEKALIQTVAGPETHPPIGASGLEQSLIRADLRGDLSSLSDLGDGRLELSFDDVAFDTLILWLSATAPRWGYMFNSFRFDALEDTPGRVAVSLQLRPEGD